MICIKLLVAFKNCIMHGHLVALSSSSILGMQCHVHTAADVHFPSAFFLPTHCRLQREQLIECDLNFIL